MSYSGNAFTFCKMEILIEATKEPLRLTLCVGDYTCFQCDAIVNYVLPGTGEESFNKGGHEGGDFEKIVIAHFEKEELRPWTIHKILSQSLPCSELICIVLPVWRNNYSKALSSRINQVLIEAMQMASTTSSVAFASFSTAPFNYPIEFYAHQMISFLTDASIALNDNQRETLTVTLFTESAECRPVFEEQLRYFGFYLEESPSGQCSSSSDKARVITLEGPDYKAFINQIYDEAYVSLYCGMLSNKHNIVAQTIHSNNNQVNK